MGKVDVALIVVAHFIFFYSLVHFYLSLLCAYFFSEVFFLAVFNSLLLKHYFK